MAADTKCEKESLWVACNVLWEVFSGVDTTELLAEYHDARLEGEDSMKDGKPLIRNCDAAIVLSLS
jgi:hypothetical protein